MADSQLLVEVGAPQFRFAGAGFVPADPGTDWTIGSPNTDGVLSLSGVTNGAARQSTKVDLGAERAPEFEVLGCVDFTGETPVAGQTVDYYWAPSTHTTQANGNVAGNSGGDAVAPDGAVGPPTLAEFLKMCDSIGSLVVHGDAVVQNGWVGVFRSTSRYGQLILVNNSGGTFEADNVEAHQVFNPIIPDAQG